MIRSSLLLAVVFLSVGACTHATVQTSGRSQDGVLSGEEILAYGGTSAFDGLRLLRHTGAFTRVAPSIYRPAGDPPVAYLDGARLLKLDTLRDIHPTTVASMEYLDGPTATIRFGTGHTGGAILLVTGPPSGS